MHRVTQTIVSNGRPRGDCFAAALASVLERPLAEVPHFVETQEEVGYYYLDLANGWLRQQKYPFRLLYRNTAKQDKPGLWYVKRALPHSARHKQQWVKWGFEIPGYWLMVVDSKLFKGSSHVIVCRDDRIVWDPSPHFGEPAYDNKPYRFHGWHYLFHVENPHQLARAA